MRTPSINFRYDAYKDDSEWVPTDLTGEVFGGNRNCTDPRKLFEQIVAEPSDLIYGIKYYYVKAKNGSSSTRVYPNLDNGIIKPNDHYKYGRCFTALPTPDMMIRKIKKVNLYPKIVGSTGLWAPAIIFHMPGTFSKVTYGLPMFFNALPTHYTEYVFEFEINRRLSVGSEIPCEDSEDYNFDFCTHKYIEHKSMEKFGCTTPFGPDKNNICTNITVAKQVFQQYQTIWKAHSVCKVPCKTYYIRPMKMGESLNTHGRYKKTTKWTKMSLHLNEEVIVSEEVFLYDGLSLIAEIGGYVGLFLGVSVNQISNIVDVFFDKVTGI